MNVTRDPKTGRFVARATKEEIEKTGFGMGVAVEEKETVNEVAEEKEIEKAIVQLTKKTLKVKTDKPLSVFPTKKLSGEPSKMRTGTEVILDFLDATDANGEQLVRVQKDGSTRTFYTTNSFAQEVLP